MCSSRHHGCGVVPPGARHSCGYLGLAIFLGLAYPNYLDFLYETIVLVNRIPTNLIVASAPVSVPVRSSHIWPAPTLKFENRDTARWVFTFVGKHTSTFASRYNWTRIHRDYFLPAFLAATRALLICFFQLKHWVQAVRIRRDVMIDAGHLREGGYALGDACFLQQYTPSLLVDT